MSVLNLLVIVASRETLVSEQEFLASSIQESIVNRICCRSLNILFLLQSKTPWANCHQCMSKSSWTICFRQPEGSSRVSFFCTDSLASVSIVSRPLTVNEHDGGNDVTVGR